MLAECDMATDLVRCTVLMLLYGQPCLHGYALMELLQARLGKVISPAIIYPFLASLLESGYVTSKRETEGRRVKILYTITPEGRRFSRRVFKRVSLIVSTAINPGLSSCAHCGCKLYEAGHKEKVDGHQMTFCCVHCAAAYRRIG
jgi:DNA-binding PadR family transcriptional regulator